MQLTPNFQLREFTTSQRANELRLNNTPNEIEIERIKEHAWVLERLRFEAGNKSISISSGFRNATLNNAVGGVPNSDHRLGYATDFRVDGLTVKETIKLIRSCGVRFDQAIDEFGRWVHLSTNPRLRGQLLSAVKRGNQTVYIPFED